jgi:hypothetical protein
VIGAAGGSYHSLVLTMPRLQLASFTVSPAAVKGGASATGRVTLNSAAGPGGQRVTLTSYNQYGYNAVTIPAYVDIPAGSSTATFPITTAKVAGTIMMTITVHHNRALSANLTIQP